VPEPGLNKPTALRPRDASRLQRVALAVLVLVAALASAAAPAVAHAIGGSDAEFVRNTRGADLFPFLYLGAKHMVTGYDHLLFLFGVIFFLYRLRDILLYVTLFSIGHSITLLAGVLMDLNVSSHLVDAVIGLSVCYKAFENLGGFRQLGFEPDTRAAVGAFGLVHGLGLATKIQALGLNPEGLIPNLIAFNVGVEIGQLLALSLILAAVTLWRATPSFGRLSVAANALLFFAGVVLTGQQLGGYFLGEAP
jgi:hypothetical protein